MPCVCACPLATDDEEASRCRLRSIGAEEERGAGAGGERVGIGLGFEGLGEEGQWGLGEKNVSDDWVGGPPPCRNVSGELGIGWGLAHSHV
jgi:hypothetical protein